MYKVVRFPPQGRFYNVIVHRWSGRTAILTVPVAYHCIFLLGFGTYDARVYIHSFAGMYAVRGVLAKVIFVEFRRWPGWAIPVAGRHALHAAHRPVADHVSVLRLHIRPQPLTPPRLREGGWLMTMGDGRLGAPGRVGAPCASGWPGETRDGEGDAGPTSDAAVAAEPLRRSAR